MDKSSQIQSVMNWSTNKYNDPFFSFYQRKKQQRLTHRKNVNKRPDSKYKQSNIKNIRKKNMLPKIRPQILKHIHQSSPDLINIRSYNKKRIHDVQPLKIPIQQHEHSYISSLKKPNIIYAIHNTFYPKLSNVINTIQDDSFAGLIYQALYMISIIILIITIIVYVFQPTSFYIFIN